MEDKILCTVQMDGDQHESDDFVAILARESGDASIFYNTDALTLGMAVKMVAKECARCLNDLSPEERKEVTDILGDAFIYDQEVQNVQ